MSIDKQVQQAFQRLDDLYQNIEPSPEMTARLIAELNVALHELQSAAEELQQQNEEMAASRVVLEEERRRYQELFDFAPDAYLTTDSRGIILEANLAAAHLFRVSEACLIGSPLTVFVLGEERSAFLNRLLEIQVDSSVKPVYWECVMIDAQRKPFPVSITVARVSSPQSQPKGLRWLLRDITEHKRRELEKEMQKSDKLESLGVLAGGIAHDLNNFLTIILGNLSLARMYIEGEHPAAEWLQEMEEGINQTQNLTWQLLTFAKGGQPLIKSASIYGLVQESTAFALSGSKSSCELLLDQGLPAVDIDRGQITQVITNLLINADQAMPQGGHIKINAHLQRVGSETVDLPLQPGNYVALTITDEGCGIPSSDLAKIFDPYFSTKEHGNGLGLTVCFSVIKNHGGHIGVTSVEGEGTSFTIYLPVAATQNEPDVCENNLLFGDSKILLMDDDKSVRQTAKEMLAFLGYEVELAVDGRQAIKLYKEALQSGSPFQAVICDLTVRGGMGGKMAVAELLTIDPNIKAIVSSGYSSDDVLANYEEYGFCDVIAKPYRLQELGNVLFRVTSQ